MIRIKIETGGAAFKDEFFDNDYAFRQRETARILRKLAEALEDASEFGKEINWCSLMDINGNRVGEFKSTR